MARANKLGGMVLVVCTLTIACANECGCSVAAPVSFINPIAQKRKVLEKLKAIEAALKSVIDMRCVQTASTALRMLMQPEASTVLHK